MSQLVPPRGESDWPSRLPAAHQRGQPNVVTETPAEYGDYFPGMGSVDLARIAQAYVSSIEGGLTGQAFAL